MLNHQNNQNIISNPQLSNQQDEQVPILYKEINFLDTIVSQIEERKFKTFKSDCCYCCNCCGKGILGNINYFLVNSIIALIFCISAIITSFSFIPKYKDLRNILLIKLEEEKLLTNYQNTFNIKHLWCNLGWKQQVVYISNTILYILVLIFEIIQKNFYNEIITKEKKKEKNICNDIN